MLGVQSRKNMQWDWISVYPQIEKLSSGASKNSSLFFFSFMDRKQFMWYLYSIPNVLYYLSTFGWYLVVKKHVSKSYNVLLARLSLYDTTLWLCVLGDPWPLFPITQSRLFACVYIQGIKSRNMESEIQFHFFNLILALFHLLVYGCVRVYVFIYHIRYH